MIKWAKDEQMKQVVKTKGILFLLIHSFIHKPDIKQTFILSARMISNLVVVPVLNFKLKLLEYTQTYEKVP